MRFLGKKRSVFCPLQLRRRNSQVKRKRGGSKRCAMDIKIYDLLQLLFCQKSSFLQQYVLCTKHILYSHNIATMYCANIRKEIAILIINLIMDSFMMDQVSISLDQCAWIEKGCEIMNDEDSPLVTPHFSTLWLFHQSTTSYPSLPLLYPSFFQYLDIIMLSDVITFILKTFQSGKKQHPACPTMLTRPP